MCVYSSCFLCVLIILGRFWRVACLSTNQPSLALLDLDLVIILLEAFAHMGIKSSGALDAIKESLLAPRLGHTFRSGGQSKETIKIEGRICGMDLVSHKNCNAQFLLWQPLLVRAVIAFDTLSFSPSDWINAVNTEILHYIEVSARMIDSSTLPEGGSIQVETDCRFPLFDRLFEK